LGFRVAPDARALNAVIHVSPLPLRVLLIQPGTRGPRRSWRLERPVLLARLPRVRHALQEPGLRSRQGECSLSLSVSVSGSSGFGLGFQVSGLKFWFSDVRLLVCFGVWISGSGSGVYYLRTLGFHNVLEHLVEPGVPAAAFRVEGLAVLAPDSLGGLPCQGSDLRCRVYGPRVSSLWVRVDWFSGVLTGWILRGLRCRVDGLELMGSRV